MANVQWIKYRDLSWPAHSIYAVLFLGVFLSYSKYFHLPVYPGYFLLQTCGVLLFFYSIYRDWQKHSPSLPPQCLFFLALWIFWAMLAILWSAKPWIVAEGLQRMMCFGFLVFGMSYLLRELPGLRRNLINITIAAVAFLGIVYTLLVYTYGRQASFEFPFANPNLAGSVLGFGCVLAIAPMCHFFSNARWWLALFTGGVALTLGMAVIFASRCKGSILAMVFTILVLLYLSFTSSKRRLLCTLLMFGFAMLCAIAVVIWREQIVAMICPSLEIRLFVWLATWRMICFTPWRVLGGWGPGNFFANFPDFQYPQMFTAQSQAPVTEYPHNFFLEITAEYGLIGLAIFLCFVLKTIHTLWQLQQSHSEQSSTPNCCAMFGGILFLLLESQVSVSLSYPHGQMLLALAVAWTVSGLTWKQIPRDKISRGLTKTCQIIYVLGLLATVGFWKLATWDSLVFYHQYTKATRIYRELMPATQSIPAVDIANSVRVRNHAVAEALSVMTTTRPPLCENYYTCQWRNDIGRLLVKCNLRYPNWARALTLFLQLEKQMPRFGFFYLNRAKLAANQGKIEEADFYFAQFAHQNPFSPELWVCWSSACQYRHANPLQMLRILQMLRVNLELQNIYGEDGGLLLGEALAWDVLDNKSKARAAMERAYLWSKYKDLDQRASNIKKYALDYLSY